MTGEVHWFVPVAVMAGALGVFCLVWFGSRVNFIVRERRSFT